MDEAATLIRAPKVAERVRHLVKIARDIFAAIERDPLRIDRVRRFLTYYLPRAAEIAEAYGSLERSSAPDAERLNATGALIDRLDTAFTRYAANLQDADLDKLDIELKLLKSSLDEDIGPAQAGAPADSGQRENLMAISRRAFGVGLVATSAAATGGYVYLRNHPEIAGRFGEARKLFGFAGGEKESFLNNARVRSAARTPVRARSWMRAAQDRSRWCASARCSTRSRSSCGRPPRSSSRWRAARA